MYIHDLIDQTIAKAETTKERIIETGAFEESKTATIEVIDGQIAKLRKIRLNASDSLVAEVKSIYDHYVHIGYVIDNM